MTRKTTAIRRVLMLGSAAVAGAVYAAPVVPSAAAMPSDGAILSYSVTAQAPLLQLTEDEPTSTFHPEGEGDIGYSFASLNPAGEHALSSLLWPGSAAGNAGTLVEVLGGPSGQAELNDPVRAEATSGTSQTQQSTTAPTGTEMSATVQPPVPGDQYAASKSALAAGSLGGPVTVGASSSASTIHFDSVTGTLTATATSTLHDLQLDGGLISIGSVTSSATATSLNGDTPTITGSTMYGGLSIAGQSAYVDGSGVHVGTPSNPAGPAALASVDSALQAAGMQVYSTQPAQVTIGEVDYYDASSLLFYWAPPGDNSNNSFTASVGSAAVSMAAGSSGILSSLGSVAEGTGSFTGSAVPASIPAANASPAPVMSLPTGAAPAITAPVAPPAQPTQAAASSLASVSLPGGLGAGWWVLILLGGLAGAGLLGGVPRAVAAKGRGASGCPREAELSQRRHS
ncbi:MAG TPA: choice-of-anchor P family protein [Acidimicrobiales bacterium]|nr:choice-of-anchor P family protein [Acidimicrobiales bacterium]